MFWRKKKQIFKTNPQSKKELLHLLSEMRNRAVLQRKSIDKIITMIEELR